MRDFVVVLELRVFVMKYPSKVMLHSKTEILFLHFSVHCLEYHFYVHSSTRRCSMQSASGLKKLSSCGDVYSFNLEINLVSETEVPVSIHKLIIVSEGFGY